MLYNNLSGYFREKYGKRMSKYALMADSPVPTVTERVDTADAYIAVSEAQASILTPRFLLASRSELP